MLPDFIRARGILKKRQHSFLVEQIREFTPSYLRQASYRNVYEGDRLSVQYEGDMVYDKPINTVSVESQPGSITDIKSNPNKVYEHLTQIAKQFVEEQIKLMINTLTEVSQLTGNVMEGVGFGVESVF